MESARGTIVHRFMEEVANHQILSGKWMKETDAADLMNELWNKGFPTKEDPEVNIIDAVDWDDNFLDKSISDSLLLVPQIYREVLPNLSPVRAESYMKIPLRHPGKRYQYLHGVIDLVNNPNAIIDWKTSKRPRRQDMTDYDMQATIYAALSGMDYVNVHFVQFVYLKRDAPRIEWDSTKRDVRHIDWLQDKYLPAVVAQIEADIYPPTPGWHCAYCPTPCGIIPTLGE